MTQTAPATVPYEVWQREHELRLEAERERDKWKQEFYLQRKIRRAPVLQPVTKAVLEECRHVEQWGMVKAPDGSTRANYTTIAKHLHTDPKTIARHAERLEKLGLIEIHEHQGPKDERDRKYVHVKEEKLSTIEQMEDPDKVIPEQGGDRYHCQQCGSGHTMVMRRLKCLDCGHETDLEPTFPNGKGSTGKSGKTNLVLEVEEEEQPRGQDGQHSVYTRAVEDELRALPQWVVWRYDTDEQGKPTKVPYIARLCRLPQKAKTNDPGTWETYDQAQAIYQQSQTEGWKHPYDGIGFVFNSNGIVGIDLDHCIDPTTGEMSETAQAIIARLGTYAEISVSRTGIHLYARGTLQRNVKRPGIELYDHARFFTWTARHLPGAPDSMGECQTTLDALCAELAPPPVDLSHKSATVADLSSSHTDAEILEHLKRDAKFAKLWNGDASDYRKKDGTPDYSRADLALCKKLSYWGAGGDVSTIDRLFRQSGLYRPKWERAGYRERTIALAIGEQERRAS